QHDRDTHYDEGDWPITGDMTPIKNVQLMQQKEHADRYQNQADEGPVRNARLFYRFTPVKICLGVCGGDWIYAIIYVISSSRCNWFGRGPCIPRWRIGRSVWLLRRLLNQWLGWHDDP